MGEMSVPADALFAAQTQRAFMNFPISGIPMPRAFIHAIGLVKASAAKTNAKLKLMDNDIAEAIHKSAIEVADGKYDEHFPVDVFQTGSGTSSNMNANEVIASISSASKSLSAAIAQALGATGDRAWPSGLASCSLARAAWQQGRPSSLRLPIHIREP